MPFTFVVTNVGTVTVDNVAIADPLIDPVICDVTVLAPGASATCAGDYVVTQVDVDAGEFTNTATASATDPFGESTDSTDSVTTQVAQSTGLVVEKSAFPEIVAAVGDTVNFSFVVTNNGTVTASLLSVTDPLVGAVTCDIATLVPGGTANCTADDPYVVTQADVDAGGFVNVATATGTAPDGSTIEGTGTETVDAPADPAIEIEKSTTTTELTSAGQIVPFTFAVTNAGNVTMSSILSLIHI